MDEESIPPATVEVSSWPLDVLIAGLGEARDAEQTCQRLAEHLLRVAPGAAVRVFLLGAGDRCSTCPRAKECTARDRCLHLVGEAGPFARPPGHALRVPRLAAGYAEVLATAQPVRGGAPVAELAAPGTTGTRSESLLLPLRTGGETVGVLALRLPILPPTGFEAQARMAALLTAAAVGTLVSRADEERRFAQLRLVHQLGRKALSILDPDLLLRQAAADVQQHFGYRHVTILTTDHAAKTLHLKAVASLYGRMDAVDEAMPITRGIVGRVARTGRTARADDVTHDPDYVAHWPDTKSELAVPVLIGGVVEAVLNVESDTGEGFSEADVVVLETAAQQLAVAIDNARLFARVKQKEEEYRTLVESAPIAVVSVDAGGRVTYANPAVADLTGLDHRTLIGASPHDLAVPEDRGGLSAALNGAMRDGTGRGVEFRVPHTDGRARFASAEVRALRSGGGKPTGVLLLARDVSREQDLQTKLAQAERLNSIGRMVSGVAHELNNPLAGILGYAQLSLQQPPEQWSRADLAKIEANAQRCKRIVENLLTFARQSRMERQPESLNAVIDSVVNLNEYVIRLDGVEIARDLDARVPPVPIDVGRWQQVFVNLAQNAREAMVESATAVRRITFRTRLRADAVEVRVEDTGPGISADLVARLFEPFVTGRASGTGLGLSLVYGIVAEHGGTVTAESEPGRGATFILRLPLPPARAPEASASPPEPGARGPLTGHGRRVLVVDDEQVVRELVARVLERHGYEVDSARDEAEARRHVGAARYDVMLLDFLLPDADGLTIHDRLVTDDPGLSGRAIFLTGGGQRQEETFTSRGLPYLLKPFDIRALAAMVQRMAGEGPPRQAAEAVEAP